MIGFKVRKIREDRNISREQMAEALHTSVRTLGKKERNEIPFSKEEIETIAKVCEVDSFD